MKGRDLLDGGAGLPSGLSGDDELAAAQREYDEAFEAYPALATTGGMGDTKTSLALYRQAYERLQRIKDDHAPR